MKRFFISTFLLIGIAFFSFAQNRIIIDDIYVTPNDAQMVNEIQSGKRVKSAYDSNKSTIYRNGAKSIVFIDQNGNQTTAISDTVYIVDGEVYADSVDLYNENDGYYLNGFKGSNSDFEYAERIRKFHNPKYTITIADPGYNDIYFLDDDYWNVYVDGMYATITPTWNNPYWYNYQFSPYSYSNWAWRNNWGYPSYFSWSHYNWSYPYFGNYYGWNDPWYSPWYGGYYGWGGYYGSYYGYGWNYPFYGGYPYYGNNWYSTTNQTARRNYKHSKFESIYTKWIYNCKQ